MSMEKEIKDQMKEAMKNKDAVRLSVMRSVKTACTNELVSQGKTPQDEASDDLVLSVIKRLAKQRKDSIQQFTDGGRPELAEEEAKELKVLEEFLPELMSQDQIQPIAEAKKAELDVEDKSKMGILIGAVMKEVGEQADGADVKAVVEELLS